MFHRGTEDAPDEFHALMALVVAVIFLVVCSVVSCREVQYAVSGRVVAAKVDSIREVYHRRSRRPDYTSLVVNYRFQDGAATRIESDDVHTNWYIDHPNDIAPDETTVQVQYLPGAEGRSRLVDHSYRWLMIPLVIAIAVIIYAAIWFWRDFSAHQRRLAKQR